MSTAVDILALIASGSAGAVVHRAWADFGAYLQGHKAEVDAAADELVNRGIDVLAEVAVSSKDSNVVHATVSVPAATSAVESSKTADVPADGEVAS